jgi:amino acid transporter
MSIKDQVSQDEKVLHEMGYAQELRRRMNLFSNFAISFSIICIIAGGITSLQSGISAVGGASVGIGWPLASIFAMIVAACMGQIASAYPTAGGLYHWSSILGGRMWGWITAWINMLGLIFVVSSVNVGTWTLFVNFFGPSLSLDPNVVVNGDGNHFWPAYCWQLGAIIVITITQAIFNHVGIRTTTRLTDFSGYLIFVVAVVLTIALLAYAPSINLSRLWTFTNYTGDPGGGVWPQNSHMWMAFLLALLLPAYTITGFDASAHTSEETVNAQHSVPRGMLHAVFWSFIFGWIMVCAFALAMPDTPDPKTKQLVDGVTAGASQGANVFYWLMGGSAMPDVLKKVLYVGIVLANYICALSGLTSLSRMVFAFARDGGFWAPSGWLRHVSVTHRTPVNAIWAGGVLTVLSTLYASAFTTLAAGCAAFLYLSYAMPIAAGMVTEGGSWTKFGPFRLGIWSRPLALISVVGAIGLYYIGIQPPNDPLIMYSIGLIILLVAIWLIMEFTVPFAGPPVTAEAIARRQAEIKAEEAAVGETGAG